ncbi:hypothetical protein HDU93_007311 [Gonapodya sp. JEL0774]|nr:hypothetical protein HDU93_007311 [Gonapodya sp. JEL0774]
MAGLAGFGRANTGVAGTRYEAHSGYVAPPPCVYGLLKELILHVQGLASNGKTNGKAPMGQGHFRNSGGESTYLAVRRTAAVSVRGRVYRFVRLGIDTGGENEIGPVNHIADNFPYYSAALAAILARLARCDIVAAAWRTAEVGAWIDPKDENSAGASTALATLKEIMAVIAAPGVSDRLREIERVVLALVGGHSVTGSPRTSATGVRSRSATRNGQSSLERATVIEVAVLRSAEEVGGWREEYANYIPVWSVGATGGVGLGFGVGGEMKGVLLSAVDEFEAARQYSVPSHQLVGVDHIQIARSTTPETQTHPDRPSTPLESQRSHLWDGAVGAVKAFVDVSPARGGAGVGFPLVKSEDGKHQGTLRNVMAVKAEVINLASTIASTWNVQLTYEPSVRFRNTGTGAHRPLPNPFIPGILTPDVGPDGMLTPEGREQVKKGTRIPSKTGVSVIKTERVDKILGDYEIEQAVIWASKAAVQLGIWWSAALALLRRWYSGALPGNLENPPFQKMTRWFANWWHLIECVVMFAAIAMAIYFLRVFWWLLLALVNGNGGNPMDLQSSRYSNNRGKHPNAFGTGGGRRRQS